MEKENTSSIIKITMIISFVFCSLFSLMGLISLFSFEQMVKTDIRLNGYGVIIKEDFAKRLSEVATANIIAWCVIFLFVILNLVYFVKFLSKNKNIVNLLVQILFSIFLLISLIVCVLVIVQSFDLIKEVPKFSDYYSASKSYYDYICFQSYQSATFSAFIPLTFISFLFVSVNIGTIVSRKTKFSKTSEKE